MKPAHVHLGITKEAFDKTGCFLAKAFSENGVGEGEIKEMVEIFNSLLGKNCFLIKINI